MPPTRIDRIAVVAFVFAVTGAAGTIPALAVDRPAVACAFAGGGFVAAVVLAVSNWASV